MSIPVGDDVVEADGDIEDEPDQNNGRKCAANGPRAKLLDEEEHNQDDNGDYHNPLCRGHSALSICQREISRSKHQSRLRRIHEFEVL